MSFMQQGMYNDPVMSNNREGFANPFADMASMYLPNNIKNALQLCEFLFNRNSTYRSAMDRVCSYFVTEVEVNSPPGQTTSDDERDKCREYLHDGLGILPKVQQGLWNRICYGNTFFSLVVPFKRMLVCKRPRCGTQYALTEVADPKNQKTFHYKFQNYEFHATCPKCQYTGEWDVFDIDEKDEGRVKIKIWNPKEIEIRHDLYTDDRAYLWRIPEDYKRDIASGDIHHLERVSKEVLKAIKGNQLFKFNDDVIYHMHEPVVAGLNTRGWGIPRSIINFSDIYYVEVLRRHNEAIALDYVIPLRLITPATKGGADAESIDPLRSVNMGDFMGSARRMLRNRRKDPCGWQTMPYPVQYQVLGADASQLAPRDLIEQGYDALLNGSGVPVEMYKGTLSLQVAPVALRQFEATWQHLVHDINQFLSWLVRRLSQVLNWQPVTAKMRRVTYVDDINQQMALLQLMMGNAISGTTALRPFGMVWKDEQRRMIEEQRYLAEQSSKVNEEMAQSEAGKAMLRGQGSMAPGGQPAQPGAGGDPNAMGQMGTPASTYLNNPSNSSRSPDDMMADAAALATELGSLPDSQRRSELMALKDKDLTMHRLVKAELEDQRSRARSAGAAMIMQQQQQPK